MKYLVIIFLFCCVQSSAQITGNPHVKDSKAIELNAGAVNSMMGKWKLIKTVETIHKEEQTRDRGILVEFGTEGDFIISWCVDCHEEKAGQWQVLNQQSIKIEATRTGENRYLAGDWVVYALTDQEMILAKVLTSSGDWNKLQYFSRNIGNPPLSEVNRYCINCTSGDSLALCFGDKPDETKRQWAVVHDLINADGDQHQHSTEILERFEWLLSNAPCINNFLYVNSANYYEKLIKSEENKQVIKSYQEKITKIKEQQQLYFKK